MKSISSSSPSLSDPGGFNDWKTRLQGTAKKRGLPEPLLSGYLARLEELQPYNAWNPSIWGAWNTPAGVSNLLEQISTLDNIDKHRVIHTPWHGADWWPTHGELPDLPERFTRTGSSTTTDPLEEDAYIGAWHFTPPLPSDWQPTQVEMKRAFPLEVCIPTATLVHNAGSY